LYLLW
jgi:hypothetical protein